MQRPKTFWAWITASGALLLLLACGYPAGLAIRQATDMAAGEAAADTPGASPLEEAPAGAALPPGRIGQRIEQGGVGFTVQSVERSGTLGQYPAAPGKEYVIVDVLLENSGSEPLASPVSAFRLQKHGSSSAGEETELYTSVSVVGLDLGDAAWQWPESLPAGEQVSGRRAFVVDQDAANEELVLSFEPFEFFANDVPPIEVALVEPPRIAGQPTAQVPADTPATDAPDVGAGAPVDAPPAESEIGQRRESDGVALTVISVERTKGFLSETASQGQEFVVLEVLIENNSSESIMIGNLMFSLSSSGGEVFLNSFLKDPQEVQTGWLDDSADTQGRLVFDVPESAQSLFLTYNPIGLADAQPITVALGNIQEEAASQPQQSAPPEGGAAVAVVTGGANLRSEPRIANDTIIGQVCPGDQVEVQEQRGNWYRVRVYAIAENCVPGRVAPDAEGWVSADLLSSPVPARPGGGSEAQPGDRIAQGGNMRSEPNLANDTIIGQVCPGDGIEVLEERTVGGTRWYRIRVTSLAADCVPQHVAEGTEGWVSNVLLGGA